MASPQRRKIDSALRKKIYERDRYICQLGGEKVILTKDVKTKDDFMLEATLDHIIPPGQGGKDTLDNLRTACRKCNTLRSNGKSPDEVKFLDLNKGQYTRIHNSLIAALARTKLNSEESRIVFAIFAKTYGFNKASDWISNSQLELMTGIHRTHCSRAVQRLARRKIVTKTGNSIRFNKYFFQWEEKDTLPKQATLPIQARSVAKTGNSSAAYSGYHKRHSEQKKELKDRNHVYKHGENPKNRIHGEYDMQHIGALIKKHINNK